MNFRLNNAPRPTSLDDVFVRDVPLDARRRIADAAMKAKGDDPWDAVAELGLLLFQEAIVDKDGNRYGNIDTVADVVAMGMDRLLDVQNAVLEAISPGKRSSTTARSRSKSTSSSKASRQRQ